MSIEKSLADDLRLIPQSAHAFGVSMGYVSEIDGVHGITSTGFQAILPPLNAAAIIYDHMICQRLQRGFQIVMMPQFGPRSDSGTRFSSCIATD